MRFTIDSRRYKSILVSLSITLFMLAHVGGWITIPYMDRLESLLYDSRIRLTAPNSEHPYIVIVDIDERSLAAEGRWPWRRDKVAQLVDTLFDDYEVAVLGVDLVFGEPDDSSALELLERLKHSPLGSNPTFQQQAKLQAPLLDRDEQLATAIADRKVVLGYYFNTDHSVGGAFTNGELPFPVFRAKTFQNRDVSFLKADGYGANLEELQASAWSAGHFNQLSDSDGVTRRIPLLIRFQDNLYEALSLAIIRALLDDPPIHPVFATTGDGSYSGLELLNVADYTIPVDKNAAILLSFRGQQGSFHYVSATDILQAKVPLDRLKNKIVLLGTSAPGLLDLRNTPIDTAFPGVELHANAIASILDGNIKHRPAYTLGATLVSTAVIGCLMSILLSPTGLIGSLAITVFGIGIAVSLNLFFWTHERLVLPLAPQIVLIASLFIASTAYGFLFESRARKKVVGLFGQYVPPGVVDQLQRHPNTLSMEGQSRNMTVLFSDIRNFTSLSENLTAKELATLLNIYLSRMTEIIYQYEGTVDKYIGDAIMAFWGAPLDNPDHAQQALKAAIDMQIAAESLRHEFERRGWPALHMGIGLNSGDMSVGNMGSSYRRAYTVLGDNVNLGSRLESLTKQYGVKVLVSETTKAGNPDTRFLPVDKVRAKGKEVAVEIFEPIVAQDEDTQRIDSELGRWDNFLNRYRNQQWSDALMILESLKGSSIVNAQLIGVYQERIDHFVDSPPPKDWDGVFTFQTK
ncbi:MAG: adenylate/guanylate cyclase domain-containing protein [Oceanospirillaceae bacterium]|nr:adenylate/guanylate cyclase domain-containing protein [Oceanospirillaceae bacterium]